MIWLIYVVSKRTCLLIHSIWRTIMSDISLTASMRTNLLALQNTQSLVDRTQERLSTGLKVNSALDNASSYYAARSLNNRASDLSSLLDSMGQGIQTIKAASEGVEAITDFVEQAKAIANSARDTTDDASRAKYMEQFNEILDQIDTLAKDSSYKGINLLNKETLTVTFNETIKNPSKVEIQGVDSSSAGLGLKPVAEWTSSAHEVKDETEAAKVLDSEAMENIKEGTTLSKAEKEAIVKELVGGDLKSVTLSGLKGADGTTDITYNFEDDNYPKAKAFDPTAIEAWLKKNIDSGIKAKADGSGFEYANGNLVSASDITKAETELKSMIDAAISKSSEYETAEKSKLQEKQSEAVIAEAKQVMANKGISDTLETVSTAINTLRDYASAFGNYNTIVQTRQEFTKNLINVLTEGADNLTLADMNEESANMLALQTRQQLGVNSLSLASQAAQSVLALF